MQIGPKGAEYIADALKYNTTLSTLDLRANGLGDDVWVFCLMIWRNISYYYAHCSSLIELLLILFIQGAVRLAQSLKIVNEALTSLDLGFNEIRVCAK